jgi:phosphomannomutase/phosphoglucomutase
MLTRRGQTTIWVGGDFRRSTPDYKRALIDGLIESGVDVFDVGLLPTPAVYFAGENLPFPQSAGPSAATAANVAIVTASHNAGKYNGIKFLLAGRPALPETLVELKRGLRSPPCSGKRGSVKWRPVADEYEHWLLHQADAFLATRFGSCAVECSPGPPKILLDSMNGATTEIAPRVFRTAGYTVRSITDRIDPDFAARTPNPAHDENLQPLQSALESQLADLGIAFDGDGDRVVFVDPNCGVLRPEQIAVLLVRHFFDQPTVVYDLKCASIVRQAALEAGGEAIMQPSGHGFIKSTMIQRQADLGVEVSGHHFFGRLAGGDDGLFTALVVAGLVRRSGASLAELTKSIVWPSITPDLRIAYDGDAEAVVQRIAAACGVPTTRLDGVRAEYPAGWALARASITEPAVTFRFEGRDRESLLYLAREFLAGVPDLLPRVLEKIHG